jgi:hypothetical protein
VIATFGALSLTSALMTHLNTPGAVAVAGLAGIVNARAWYGLAAAAARGVRGGWEPLPGVAWGNGPPQERREPGGGRPPRGKWLPVAPLAAVMVIALVVGMARLAFTGTVRFAPGAGDVVASPVTVDGGLGAPDSGPGTAGGPAAASAPAGTGGTTRSARGAVLVVEGFGSTCCHSANALRAAEPQMVVRQFSYQGLDAAGQPIPYHLAGNMSIQVLGDRMAAQVEELNRLSGTPVDIVAESEGTLGVYAMLARHPDVPTGSVALLSPIVAPGQLGQAGSAAETVPGAALNTLNDLVGGMSPYGRSGAQALINSVSEVGASYFARVSRDRGLPWLAVVPLADAVTLPACSWPQNVIFVEAFHGGLLGDPAVRRIIETFLADSTVADQDLDGLSGDSQQDLRNTAQLIASAAAAWRMPDLHPECRSSSLP